MSKFKFENLPVNTNLNVEPTAEYS